MGLPRDQRALRVSIELERSPISFKEYVKQLCLFVVTSSFVLALIIGVVLLFYGDGSMNVDGNVEFGDYDGLIVILGLPLASVFLFVLLSPLSFLVYRALRRKRKSRGDDG